MARPAKQLYKFRVNRVGGDLCGGERVGKGGGRWTSEFSEKP